MLKSSAVLTEFVQGQYPDVSVGWKVIGRTAAWNNSVAFEHRAAAVDATCRADLRNNAMTIALPQLETFARVHATDLTRAAAARKAQRTLTSAT